MNAYIVKGHNALKMHDQHQISFLKQLVKHAMYCDSYI